MVLTDFVSDGLEREFSTYFFFCLIEKQVEEIAWKILAKINRDYALGCRMQEHKLKVTLPTGSQIQLFGSDNLAALDRFLGIKLRKVAFDEAAFYTTLNLEEMVEDTIGPRLVDERGQLYLMSTPPRHPHGLFYEIIKGFGPRKNMSGVESPSYPGWSCHSWTTLDNPSMRSQWKQDIARKRKNDPELETRVWFRRTYLGENVHDTGKLVYEYDPVRNLWREDWEHKPGDRFVLGLDLGWDDATAFSFNTWRPTSKIPLLLELDAYKESHMRMDAIASHVTKYRDYVDTVHGESLDIVCDYAHKQYFEELARRYDIPLLQSEKPKKYDWIKTLNSDYNLGYVQLLESSTECHREEMSSLPWKIAKQTGKRVEYPNKPNDSCDAHLAAYRHAYHYIHEEEEPKIDLHSEEWYRREEERMVMAAQMEDESGEERPWYDP
jgi:hypothetical protein